MINQEKFTYFGMFVSSKSDEPESWKWGHKVMTVCEDNNIEYKTTYMEDAPECTIWVDKNNKEKLKKLLK